MTLLIIPAFEQARGPLSTDPCTGSTLSTPQNYCDDLTGCGTNDHRKLQQSMSINSIDECGIRSLAASVSVAVILAPEYLDTDGQVNAETLIDQLKLNLAPLAVPCP